MAGPYEEGSAPPSNEEHNINKGAQAVYEAPINVLALVASLVLLALFVMRSPEPLNVRWRPADLWRRIVRLSQVYTRRVRRGISQLRRRIDLLLLQMLEQQRRSWPQSRRAYQSKHRHS